MNLTRELQLQQKNISEQTHVGFEEGLSQSLDKDSDNDSARHSDTD
jgi:hypothetical protein